MPPAVVPPPIPPVDGAAVVPPPIPPPSLPPGLVEKVAKLSINELKDVIDGAGLDRGQCLEKDDLREVALQAASAGAAIPEKAVDVSDGAAAPEPEEKRELFDHWSTVALRIQLVLLGKAVPESATKSELVELYWAHLSSTGAAFGPEVGRRWLQVASLDKDTQALKFIEGVTGVEIPDVSLQDALKPGILLCDLASVFLQASGKSALNPSRVVADGTEGQAALSRLRAKQIENLALYQAGCLSLGVAHSNTFNPEDLYDGKNLASVTKNIHALAQVAHRLIDYRGPQMGPKQRKDKTWTQRSSVVATDWRQTATTGVGTANLTGLNRSDIVRSQHELSKAGLGKGGEMSFIGGAGVTAMKQMGNSGEVRLGGVGSKPLQRQLTKHLATPEEDGEQISPLEEVLANPTGWRDKYEFVEVVDGASDEDAAVVWVKAVLTKYGLDPPPSGSTMVEVLGSGAALCRMLNAISPGSIANKKLCDENPKKFEQMAAVDAYVKGCTKIGCSRYTFVTNDLHEGKDVKAVARQLWALALHLRTDKGLRASFRGPHLGTQKEATAGKEAIKVREEAWEKEEKRKARERKRIERDMLSEEMEDERQLIETLRRLEEEEVAAKKRQVSAQIEAREAAHREAERQEQLAMKNASPSGYLYKRGGVAKLWRKRWFVIADGELSYWPAQADEQNGKPPLGVLYLANACARPPTDPKSKGKYQSTCFRVDLDPEAQQEGHEGSVPAAGSAAALGGASVVGASAKSTKSRSLLGGLAKSMKSTKSTRFVDDDGEEADVNHKEKYKYLLAAESAQGMSKWMESIDFWSRKHGDDMRRSLILQGVTQEEEAILQARAKHIKGVETSYLQDNEEEEDDDDDVEADAAAIKAAAESAFAERRRRAESISALGAGVPSEKAELMAWSPRALAHNLAALGGGNGAGKSKKDLVEMYWSALESRGLANDETARRWLAVPKESSEEASARLWIGCLLNTEVEAATPLQTLLRSGEMLCEVVNVISPGLIEKVARAELLAAMTESRRNARMRENIGLFVDACAELGVPRRDLFLTAELFEGKNLKSVVRAIHALARRCHANVPGFNGPHIGIKKSGGGGGGGGGSSAPASGLTATASRKASQEDTMQLDGSLLSAPPTSTRL